MAVPGLSNYGWNSAVAERFSEYLALGLTVARVVAVDRAECDTVTGSGPVRAATAGVHVCTGDWVLLGGGAVCRVLPRWSALTRSAVAGQSRAQVLAANIDTVLVCLPALAPLRLAKLERMLALAWESGAQPVVVLTKADVVEDVSAMVEAAASAAPGAAVVAVSAATGAGLEALTAQLAGTVVVIGPSGAGKSTLSNALLGTDAFATGAVRAADGKGRHTTVRRELVPLPSGGTLIDTPGLRAAGLFGAADGVERTFSDVESLTTSCRFRDCQHEAEPGCAVTAAIAAGRLAQRRLDSYRKLMRENDRMATRTDARLAAERKRGERELSRAQRSMYRTRKRR